MDIGVVRKDAPVADSIARLQGILDAIGFRTEQALVERWTAGEDCHSCHLRYASYPLLYANGKGVTPELAHASALAEFVERLECRADGLFTDAGNIHHLTPFTTPEWRTASDILADVPELAAHDLRPLGDVGRELLACVPMIDVFDGRVVDLPFDLLCSITGTTGMCAGNTPEEALCHGICEVFERHAIHEVATGRVEGLPTLPLSALSLDGPVIRRQVQSIQAAGIELLVKDASFGGDFPVVAAVLLDRRAGSCGVSFGSDPVLEVALSRCLTEAFQGQAGLSRAIPPTEGFVKPLNIYNSPEALLDRLMTGVGRARLDSAFCRTNSNRDALRFVVERTQRAGHRLYLRDCSIFGFPAYYVYIEGLSALRPVQPAHSTALGRHLQDVRATLFRLERATPEEIASCGRVLFDELTTCNPLLEVGFAQQVLLAPVGCWVGLRPLLSLMLLEAGESGKARVVAEWPPLSSGAVDSATRGATPVEELAAWLPAYGSSRHRSVSAEAMHQAFVNAFGARPSGRPRDGEAPIPRLPVPSCRSVYSCPSCACRQYCRLDQWYRLARSLRERVTVVNSEDLRGINKQRHPDAVRCRRGSSTSAAD